MYPPVTPTSMPAVIKNIPAHHNNNLGFSGGRGQINGLKGYGYATNLNNMQMRHIPVMQANCQSPTGSAVPAGTAFAFGQPTTTWQQAEDGNGDPTPTVPTYEVWYTPGQVMPGQMPGQPMAAGQAMPGVAPQGQAYYQQTI